MSSKPHNEYEKWSELMDKKEEAEKKQQMGEQPEKVDEDDEKTKAHPLIDSNLLIKNVRFTHMPQVVMPPNVVPKVLREDLKWHDIGSPGYTPLAEIKKKRKYRKRLVLKYHCERCQAKFAKSELLEKHMELAHK